MEGKIRSARLPIGTYLSTLKTRKVLTVNQTFDILLKWIETRDWEKALWDVVPRRKFQDKGKGPNGDVEGTKREDGHPEDEGEKDSAEVVIDVQALEDGGEDAEVGDSADIVSPGATTQLSS